MPIGKVWIYRLLLVFFCNFVCLYGYGFFSPKIKLAASNFARWFIGVLGRESPIRGTLLFQKPDEKEPSLACRARLTDVTKTFYL